MSSKRESEADYNDNLVQYGLGDVEAWSTLLSESRHIYLIMSMVTADHYYPDSGCLVDFFLQFGLKNCWHEWGLNRQHQILVLSQVAMIF